MCKFCENLENIHAIEDAMNIDVDYCPVCGVHIAIPSFLDLMKKIVYKPPIETVEIDGETLIVDREMDKHKTADLCILNWENTNIDRELGWLGGEQE